MEPADEGSRQGCLTRDILARVGDKWSLYVVIRLGEGTKRFRELHRQIDGISERMLTLRALERDGLVTRTVFAVVPPRVDYALTETGQSLLQTVSPLFLWCAEHVEKVTQARATYDAVGS